MMDAADIPSTKRDMRINMALLLSGRKGCAKGDERREVL